jgi:Ca2+-binding EF-hand superfamily protein
MMKNLLLPLLLAAPIAFAQETPSDQKPKKPKPDAAQRFQSMDKDKDGKLSKDEFMANKKGEWVQQAEKAFAGKDKDGDGYLTLEEFTAKGK